MKREFEVVERYYLTLRDLIEFDWHNYHYLTYNEVIKILKDYKMK